MGWNFCFGGSKFWAIGANLLPKNDTVSKKAKLTDGERERYPGPNDIVEPLDLAGPEASVTLCFRKKSQKISRFIIAYCPYA